MSRTATTKTTKTGKPFDNDRIEELRSKDQYLVASSGKNTRKLSGAKQYWVKNPDVIYIPDLRLTGTLEEIQQFLRQNNYDVNLDDYFYFDPSSLDDEASLKAFEDEVNASKRSRSPRRGKTLTQRVKPATSKTTKTTKRTTSGGRGGSQMKSFPDKYRELEDNKVLDVSKMTERGTGVKKIDPPGEKSAKIQVDDVPVISNDPKTYRAAMSLLGEDFLQYADVFDRLYQQQQSKRTTSAERKPRTKKTTAASIRGGKRTSEPVTKTTLDPSVRSNIRSNLKEYRSQSQERSQSPERAVKRTASPPRKTLSSLKGTTAPTKSPLGTLKKPLPQPTRTTTILPKPEERREELYEGTTEELEEPIEEGQEELVEERREEELVEREPSEEMSEEEEPLAPPETTSRRNLPETTSQRNVSPVSTLRQTQPTTGSSFRNGFGATPPRHGGTGGQTQRFAPTSNLSAVRSAVQRRSN